MKMEDLLLQPTVTSSKNLEPPSKRMRSHDDSDRPELNDDKYEEMIKELQTEYRMGCKGGRNQALLNN